jgi:RNA recognition motif-containing protein
LLKENLYDELLKYGKIISIRIEGEAERKVCFVFFRNAREAQAACEAMQAQPFTLNQSTLRVELLDFSAFIQLMATINGVLPSTTTNGHSSTNGTSSSSSSSTNTKTAANTPALNSYTTSLVSSLSHEEELDEYCSRATRTLYIGNLERDVKNSDLRDKLDKKYGDIVEIEIKRDPKRTHSGGQFAFVQFADIRSVVKAMRCMHGKVIGGNSSSSSSHQQPVKLGFGRSLATSVLWLDGVSAQLKEKQLYEFFRRYCDSDAIKDILVDRNKGQALVYFAMVDDARACAEKIR